MRPIKIYLIVCSNKVDWIASVHRDLDDVLLAWEAVRRLPDTIGIVHVGISKPHTSRLGSIAANLSNCLLLTASARWVFDSIGTYSEAIDHVDCLGIHVALSGWGDANADAIDKALAHQAQQFNDKIIFTSPWLTDLERSDYELAREAWKRNVRDEESYHALEQSLSWQLRTSLGLARMHHLMKTRDYEDPIQVATACPPWLLESRIDEIGGTVRCVNALNYANIKVVGDLLELTTRDLLKIPNLGSKSVLDLASALTAAVQKGPNEINSSHSMGREDAEKNTRFTSDLRTNEAPTVFLERHPSRQSFRHAFESVKSRLSETQWFVLARRIGSGIEKMILQDIGEEMLITRERVRQIESKATEIFRVDAVWTSELLPRINNLLFDREDPLPAFGLGAFDPWFEGIEEAMPEFEYVLDRVLEGQLNLLDINGCRFVTQLSKIDWLQSIRDGNGLLEVAAEIKMPKSQIKRQVEELLFNKGSELASELWASVQIPAIFTKDEEGVERVVGVGTGAEKLVSAVLEASDRPLHYTEIPKHVSDAFGRSIEIRRAHSAARNVGLLFGRGTFGTNRHLSLTPSESESLREEAEYIILAGARDRQWTCHELIQALGERVLDFQDRINQYVLQICLQNSTVLSDLGRFVWAQSGERPIGVQNRIDISQAILSLLQICGRPMSREEIRNALQADRGLGNYFQIQPKGSLVRVAPGSWGILERDIPLDQVEIKSMQVTVAILLTESAKGIHLSEIKHLLYPTFPEVQRISDPHAIFSVLSFDSRFKLSASGYIYFKEWEGPRRLSQGDAIVEVLRRSGPQGLRATEIAKQATELLGRPVESENVYSAIIANGSAYNEDSGRWILPEENSSTDSGDE